MILSLLESSAGGDAAADDDNAIRLCGRRSKSDLRLSDAQRRSITHANPSVSTEDLVAMLASTAAAKLEREETLKEVLMEKVLARRAKMEEMRAEERKSRTKRPTMRRSGIVDGGLMISMTIMAQPYE